MPIDVVLVLTRSSRAMDPSVAMAMESPDPEIVVRCTDPVRVVGPVICTLSPTPLAVTTSVPSCVVVPVSVVAPVRPMVDPDMTVTPEMVV